MINKAGKVLHYKTKDTISTTQNKDTTLELVRGNIYASGLMQFRVEVQ